MRILRLGSVLGMLLALLVAPMASAAAPPTTVLTIDVQFEVGETFTATGGVICDSGTAETDPVFVAGFGRMGRGVGTFHLVKTLTCDDGSGNVPDPRQRRDRSLLTGHPRRLRGRRWDRRLCGLHGAGSLVGTANGRRDHRRLHGHADERLISALRGLRRIVRPTIAALCGWLPCIACVLELALRQVIEPCLFLPEHFQLVRTLGGVKVDCAGRMRGSPDRPLDRIGRWVDAASDDRSPPSRRRMNPM